MVEALLPDFSLADLALVRALFEAEMACEAVTQRHESLHQLSFYLYELGQLKDAFCLYEAKLLAPNMDVGVLLDREMMTVRHEVAGVIGYAKAMFRQQPPLQMRYPTMLQELSGLLTHPDYDDLAAYRAFIRGYFYGHEDTSSAAESAVSETAPATTPSSYQPKPKPSWKVW